MPRSLNSVGSLAVTISLVGSRISYQLKFQRLIFLLPARISLARALVAEE
jgi:hypothetical protein